MSTTPTCIITGCDLVCGDFTQYGDLWEMGDVYIFNAVGEPSYEDIPGDKFLKIADSFRQNYFERRNVYVVCKSEADLSYAARQYVEGSRR